MRFADIIGLEEEKNRLRSFITSDRIPHAMILHGPEGSAKLALGLAFVNYMQCLHPADGEPCGKCNACQKTFKMIHPDVHFYFPMSGGKDYTVIEYTNDWRNAVLNNPYLSIAHWQETIEKDNILLKLVEEPPANSLILLITENIQALLPTLLSRCQSVSIPTFKDEEIKRALLLQGIKDDSMIQNITKTVEGNMFEAMNMAREYVNPHSERMIHWMRLCFKKKADEIIQWCDTFASEGRDAHRQFLKYGLKYIEQVVFYKITRTETEGFSADEWKGIKGLSAQLSVEEIQLIGELFSDHMYYIERNANSKVLLTALSLNLGQILNRVKPDLLPIMS